MTMANNTFEMVSNTCGSQIDKIPSYSQQPRSKSSPPKRRTDFSVFQCYPSSDVSNSVSLSESSHDEVKLFPLPWTDDQKEVENEEPEYLDPALVPCSNLQNDPAIQFSCKREAGKESCDTVETSASSPLQSEGIDDFDVTLADLAKAKAAARMKWPAEELEIKGHRTSLIHQRDNTSDKRTSSTSSGAADNFLESGRGKRVRKRKVHFDDMTTPVKSERKARRFKIMRQLGLVAPIGSPF